MKENNYLNIPEEDLQEIEQALETLNEKLLPHLSDLTKKQRRYMPKLGDKNMSFVHNALDYAEVTPEIVPSYLELEEMKKIREKIEILQHFFNSIEVIRNGLRDSLMDAGNKLVEGSFLIYDNVKTAARANITGAWNAYRALKDSYPGRGPSKANQEDSQ